MKKLITLYLYLLILSTQSKSDDAEGPTFGNEPTIKENESSCTPESLIRFFWVEPQVLVSYMINPNCNVVSCTSEIGGKTFSAENCTQEIFEVEDTIAQNIGNTLKFKYTLENQSEATIEVEMDTKNPITVSSLEYDFGSDTLNIYLQADTIDTLYYSHQALFFEPFKIETVSKTDGFKLSFPHTPGVVHILTGPNKVPIYHIIIDRNINVYHHSGGFLAIVNPFQRFYNRCKPLVVKEKLETDDVPTILTHTTVQSDPNDCIFNVSSNNTDQKRKIHIIASNKVSPSAYSYATQISENPFKIHNYIGKYSQTLRYVVIDGAPFNHVKIDDAGEKSYGQINTHIPIKKRAKGNTENVPKVYGILTYGQTYIMEDLN